MKNLSQEGRARITFQSELDTSCESIDTLRENIDGSHLYFNFVAASSVPCASMGDYYVRS